MINDIYSSQVGVIALGSWCRVTPDCPYATISWYLNHLNYMNIRLCIKQFSGSYFDLFFCSGKKKTKKKGLELVMCSQDESKELQIKWCTNVKTFWKIHFYPVKLKFQTFAFLMLWNFQSSRATKCLVPEPKILPLCARWLHWTFHCAMTFNDTNVTLGLLAWGYRLGV